MVGSMTAAVAMLNHQYHSKDSALVLDVPMQQTPLPNAANAGANAPRPVLAAYQDIAQTYRDFAGFVFVPDTKISYHVFQGEDNNTYLRHNRDGKKRESGEIFLDYRCDAANLSRHLILYGHNMRNGTMFGTLSKYRKEGFAREHRIITFDTRTDNLRFEVFAVRVVDLAKTGNAVIRTHFEREDQWLEYIRQCQRESLFDFGVALCADDVVLTLLTCCYDYEDSRLLVQARLVR
jgi:sortase B